MYRKPLFSLGRKLVRRILLLIAAKAAVNSGFRLDCVR